jgi:hypothetical protein
MLTVDVDYLMLVPAGEGYGRARAVSQYVAGPLVAYDQFTGVTGGAVLNGRVAPLGGTWATSGSTTDFTGNAIAQPNIARNTTSDTGLRYAVLGATNYTNVDAVVKVRVTTTVAGGASSMWQGVIARWVDANNYLAAFLVRRAPGGLLPMTSFIVQKRVAGVETQLSRIDIEPGINLSIGTRIVAYTTGRWVAQLLDHYDNLLAEDSGFDPVLATAGALATGKPGFLDLNGTADSIFREYDNFFVATPDPEVPVVEVSQSMEVRSDVTIKENSGGTYYGRPALYRGTRFFMPPGTSRVAVVARSVDRDLQQVDSVGLSTSVQVAWTPRGLAVPR